LICFIKFFMEVGRWAGHQWWRRHTAGGLRISAVTTIFQSHKAAVVRKKQRLFAGLQVNDVAGVRLVGAGLLDAQVNAFPSKRQSIVLRIVLRELAHFSDGRTHVVVPEQGGAGDECVRAGASAFGNGLMVDAAVHFEAVV